MDNVGGLPAAELFHVARLAGVTRAFHPENGVPGSGPPRGSNTARLFYSVVSVGEIDKGIATLAEVFDL